MPKCSFCKRKASLGTSLDCKWCKNTYCIGCLPFEIHKCEKIDDYKENALKDLYSKLESGKTTSTKIIKI